MTHSDLVSKAREWLVISKSCNPVFTERGSAKTQEMPDAIGWSSDGSIVVECKVSKSDFKADAKKPFRVDPSEGMGKFRFMLMPHELFKELEGRDFGGWGILTYAENMFRPKQVRLRGSKEHEFNKQAEINFLRSRVLEVQRFGR